MALSSLAVTNLINQIKALEVVVPVVLVVVDGGLIV